MTPTQGEQIRDLDALLAAVCDQSVTPAEIEELESLAGDPESLCYVVDYFRLDGLLRWEYFAKSGRGDDDGQASDDLQRRSGREPSVSIGAPVGAAPTQFGFLGGVCRGTLGFFSQEVPFAWLVAAVVMSIGLTIGANLYVSQPPSEIARHWPAPSARQEAVPEPVGRITGMVDVEWGAGVQGSGFRVQGSGAEYPPSTIHHPPSTPIRLGDKLVLSSGLVQLTYDTGAKVILQGPCTYEVDSVAGGFLSLGKLTAKVGERGEGRGERGKTRAEGGSRGAEEAANQKSEIRNHKSPSLSTLHSPLFTIKTPTAVVTDLGTEFGVEYFDDGTNHVQVFQGEVALASVGNTRSGNSSRNIHLTAGQAVRLSKVGTVVECEAESTAAQTFVRAMPTSKTGLLPPTAGLCLWLRADAGVFKDEAGTMTAQPGDPIAVWTDQSAAGRNVIQADPRFRPVLVSGPSGMPAVRFDGLDDVLDFNQFSLSGDCAIFAVAGNHGDGDFFVLLGEHCGDAIAPHWADRSRLVYDKINNDADRSACQWDRDYGDQLYRLFCVRKIAGGWTSTVAWHTDGLRDSLSEERIPSDARLVFNQVGARTYADNPASEPGQFGKQDIAELMVFDRDLPYIQRRTVETYLKHKYHLLNQNLETAIGK